MHILHNMDRTKCLTLLRIHAQSNKPNATFEVGAMEKVKCGSVVSCVATAVTVFGIILNTHMALTHSIIICIPLKPYFKGSVYRAGTGPNVTARLTLYYKGGSGFRLLSRLLVAQWFRMASADG